MNKLNSFYFYSFLQNDSRINKKIIEQLQDENSLSRRKNNNPRKIAREADDDGISNFTHSVSSNANGTTLPTPGLIAISVAPPSSTSSSVKSNVTYNYPTSTINIDEKASASLNTTQSSTSSVIENTTENTDEQKVFSCLLCERNFTHRSSLNKHFSTIHGIEPYEVLSQSSGLSHSFISKFSEEKNDEELAESMMEQETVIFCEVCRREFQDRASLWLHMVHAHREEASVSCGICLKICCDNITLIEHVNTAHSGDKAVVQRRYSCQVCGRQHDSRQKLLKHATLHTLIDNQGQTIQPEEMVSLNNAFAPRECTICHKKFFNEEKLNQHTQNFHNDNNETTLSPSVVYKCELCTSAHATRIDRWWHMYHSHNGDSRVTCERKTCSKIFVTQVLKDEHCKTHHESQGNFTNTCEICGKLWESRTVFYKHMMNVHPKCLPTICGICLKIFSNVPELRAHVQNDHPPLEESGGICCDVCGRPYAERSKMLRHRRVHNVTDGVPCATSVVKKKDDLLCNICPDLCFDNLEDIADHRRTVHQLFVCDLCPKFYNGNNHLWKHVSKQHKGDPSVTCNLCLRTSASRAHLERHKLKYHSDPVEKLINKPLNDSMPITHKCNLCGKIFRIRSLLKKHLKSCKGLKPQVPKMQPVNGVFPCSKCNKVFELQSVLSKHMKNSHIMHYCEVCEVEPKVGFDTKTGLLQHIREQHSNDPELVCDVDGCDKVLRLKADLQKHKQEHARGYFTYICEMCGDMFSNRKKLRKHLLTFHKNSVKYLCAVCVAILSSVNELAEHVQTNHPLLLHRPYTCQICGKCWTVGCKVIDHISKVHGKEYKPCKICWKVFTSEKEFEEHVQNHPPAEDKPSAPIKKTSGQIRSKSSLSQELAALGISFEGEESSNKRPAEEEPNFEESGKRLRKKYKCTSCKETFRSTVELIDHKLERHGNSYVSMSEEYEEEEQNLASSFVPEKEDTKTERWTDYRPIDCDCCGKTWNSKKQLWQHLIRSHPYDSMHTCGVCLQVCKNYYDLFYHLDSHHSSVINDPANRFACFVCGHYHNSQSKLDKHIGVHKNAPQQYEYTCQHCQRVYRSVLYYREHMRLHEVKSKNVSKKKDSSEFSGFSIDSILETTDDHDDVTEVDDNDIEKMEEEDDLVELEDEDSDSENDSNSSVKDLSCEANVFRGYESTAYSNQLPHSSSQRKSAFADEGKSATLQSNVVCKSEPEDTFTLSTYQKAEEDNSYVKEESTDVDVESNASCSSSLENNISDPIQREMNAIFNGKQDTNGSENKSSKYSSVNNNQKQDKKVSQFDDKRNFRNSSGEEYLSLE